MISGQGGLGQLKAGWGDGGVPLPYDVEKLQVNSSRVFASVVIAMSHWIWLRNTRQAYGPSDEPWSWDEDHLEPDVLGQRWRAAAR
jgi:hypothetical protein